MQLALRAETIVVERIKAGLSNQLYKLSCSGTQPHTVLCRIYGHGTSDLYDQRDEIALFDLLGKLGVAPLTLHKFEGGRFEEWLSGSVLTHQDMSSLPLVRSMAKVLADLHKLVQPSTAHRHALLEVDLLKWKQAASEHVTADTKILYDAAASEYDNGFLQWLFKGLPSYPPLLDVVYCHNDVQQYNIIAHDGTVRLIDFEYSGLNYAAFDVANYFCEIATEFRDDDSNILDKIAALDGVSPYYVEPDTGKEHRLWPRPEVCEVFACEYLQHRQFPVADIPTFLAITKRFALASHLIWTFWALTRADDTNSKFSYSRYARIRFALYREFKDHTFGTHA